MNVDLIRKIDYWVGIPLCFVFSCLSAIWKKLVPHRELPGKTGIDAVVFYQISEMGSAVSASPSVGYIKDKYAGVTIYYVIFESLREIIDVIGQVEKENVLTIRDKNIFTLVIDTLVTVLRVRRIKPDAAVDLELFSRFSALLSFLGGGKIIAGFNKFEMEGLYRGNFHTHKVMYNAYHHIASNFISLVKSVESQNEIPLLKSGTEKLLPEIPEIITPDDEKQKIIAKLKDAAGAGIELSKDIILINPNASQLLPQRKWPLENYIELTRNILENLDLLVVVTGLESDRPDAEAICRAVDSPYCINFAGKTDLNELIALFNISKILLSNDSGPPNFASLTEIQIIVFFGPETPVLYRPLGKNVQVVYSDYACSPCVSAYNHRKTPCVDNKCLQVIKPAEVFDRITKCLHAR